MFNSLTKSLGKAFENFRGKKIIGAKDVEAAIREIRVALLEADVALDVAKEFCQKIEEKAVGQEVVKSVSPEQMMIKIVQDELTQILTSEKSELQLDPKAKINVILLVGLQGSGKTTTAAKIAKYLKEKKGLNPLLASLDVYRPAAQEQLQILAQNESIADLPIISGEKPEKITKRALKFAAKEAHDVVILDTAGRLSIDQDLLNELKKIEKISAPVETMLVADALTGQDAINTAKNFSETVKLTGVVLTRVDGDMRGGAALSMTQTTNCPIKFLGMGEKMDALELMQPDRIASRILDMGDVVSLVEKAQEVVDEEEAADLEKKLRKGNFDLNDLLKQFKTMKKMGGFSSVLSLVPGAGKIKEMMKDKNVDEKLIFSQEAIILSMTKEERANPDKLNTSRKRRIARGSGLHIQDINRLLKRFKEMQKMMKRMQGMDQSQIEQMMPR
jgi:signal recognition particle subunit SRP54